MIWLCTGICAVIWILNGLPVVQAVKEQITSEIFMHIGLGLFLSLLALEFTLGLKETWIHLDIFWPRMVGWFLYIPSGLLVIGSMVGLRRKGKPRGSDFTSSTVIITSGIYGYVRQPMTLGLALWSVALILVFQSLPSAFLCLPSLFCFWMAAKTESSYNIRKFGDDYKKYMGKVPMWNIFITLGNRSTKK